MLLMNEVREGGVSGMKRKLTTVMSNREAKKRIIIPFLVALCLMLCGFSWGVTLLHPIIFPSKDALDIEMVSGFDKIVTADDLQLYLDGQGIADEIVAGVQANLAGNVYRIELPEFEEPSLGIRIVRTILDRLFGD